MANREGDTPTPSVGRAHLQTPEEPPRLGPPLREVWIVYAGVCAATAGLGLVRTFEPVRDAAHLGIAAVFLFVPLWLARRDRARGARHYGIDLGGLLEPPPDDDEGQPGPLGLYDLARAIARAIPQGAIELAIALGLALVIFPPFVVGFWAWHQPVRSFVLSVPADFPSFVATQLVLVGLPEEALFRGYVQTRLEDAWPRRAKVLGVMVSPRALVLQAVLFALVHLTTEPHPAKLATFFPGLLFGWIRAWRGGIGAAIVFHALSNVLADFLVRGWL